MKLFVACEDLLFFSDATFCWSLCSPRSPFHVDRWDADSYHRWLLITWLLDQRSSPRLLLCVFPGFQLALPSSILHPERLWIAPFRRLGVLSVQRTYLSPPLSEFPRALSLSFHLPTSPPISVRHQLTRKPIALTAVPQHRQCLQKSSRKVSTLDFIPLLPLNPLLETHKLPALLAQG